MKAIQFVPVQNMKITQVMKLVSTVNNSGRTE